MGTHKKILGVTYIIWGILCVLGFVFASVLVAGVLPIFIQEEEFQMVSQFIPYILGFILLPIATFSIIGGVGVLNNKDWGLTILLVLGIMLLLCYPIGTIIGIYAILVYYDDHRKKNTVQGSEVTTADTGASAQDGPN